jgi:hypothetical protein
MSKKTDEEKRKKENFSTIINNKNEKRKRKINNYLDVLSATAKPSTEAPFSSWMDFWKIRIQFRKLIYYFF